LALALPLLALLAARAAAAEPALYRFDVTLRPAQHVVEGTLTVALNPDDPRSGPEWVFFLPPNRFRTLDLRGPRRDIQLPPFDRQVQPEDIDPMLPSGLGSNGIDVLEARDPAGPLTLATETNARIPAGYSTQAGLLRIRAPDGRKLVSVTLRFRTVLPNRYVDGWSAAGLFLESWHPGLANWSGADWSLDPAQPRPAVFAGTIRTDSPGWLIAGRGLVAAAAPGASLSLPDDTYPARSLPLVFLHAAEPHPFAAGEGQGVSFSAEGGDRLDRMSRSIATRFVDFMTARFGLGVPELRPGQPGGLVLVQWDLPVGEMVTLGHIVLIPKVHRHDNPILDRVFTSRLAWALGRIWFGQTVWADEDREMWLPTGVSGYLALEFFESLWGFDARIHTITDWLNPRYRENFLESPVRALLMGNEDAPLLLSVTGYPYRRSALVVTYFKSVLVLRTLSYVTGVSTFENALAGFYRNHAHRSASHVEFERAMSAAAHESLDWFFADWFEGTPRLDYEIVDWSEVFAESGYGVIVEVRRAGVRRMPVDVEVTDVLGTKSVVRFEGITERGKVFVPLQAEPATIRLDPMEFLLEIDRRNNQTAPPIRFRPFYDWSKQSEILVTLQGTIGGNAIDGNYAGLGVAVPLSETTSIQVIPIYGERTQWVNYEVGLTRQRFIVPRLELDVLFSRLGGTTAQSGAFVYSYLTPDWLRADSSATVRLERVDAASRLSGDRVLSQESAQANNLALGSSVGFRWNPVFNTSLSLGAEHSQGGFDSSFTYTRWDGSASQTVWFNPNHTVTVSLLRSGIEGQAPIQREILIGGPGLLRGYPRTLDLVNDQVAAAQMSYEATLARGVWGGAIQVRKVGLILFADVAKGWDNHQSPDDVRQRQDVGIGLDVRVNAISFVEFPVRVDVAVPINDPQYRNVQIILFEALAFF
jgi:hypothetical protein